MRRLIAGGLTLALTACAGTPPHRLAAPTTVSAPAPAASATRSSPADAMVRGATAMVGQPYRYGGAAPGGFDCSGLVVYAAAGAGILLPRTAHEQIRAGAPVARADIRTGDLVFMRLASKELHVGIALDNQRFVHAPSAGRHVRIDNLGATPYIRGFLEARRVADDGNGADITR